MILITLLNKSPLMEDVRLVVKVAILQAYSRHVHRIPAYV